jgi:tetratricopeptide (TPR) repeat protein
MLRRRTVLALMIVGVVPAFALINSLVAAARTSREAIAVDWARRGDADLAGGRAAAAADDYRTANEYARQRNTYQLQLATALVAAGRLAEAEAQLQTLWSETPGDGVINLQLARIAARQYRVTDAVRSYHAAIDGLWTAADPVAMRRDARLELAQFLLARGERAQAQVELVAMAADPPPTAAEQVDIARLLTEADADNRALTLLAATLRLDPANARAASLAGSIEARLGNYRDARVYLERSRRAGGLDADGAALLDTVTRVLDFDPDVRGISSRERLRRTVRAFEVASAALDRCPAEPLVAMRERRDRMARQVSERMLARDPDAVDDTLAFTASALDAVRTACGEGSADERALALVFQRRPTS